MSRILVVVDAPVPVERLEAALRAVHAEAGPGPPEIAVVAPALNSRLRHWCSDDRGARRRAAEHLLDCVGGLARAGWTVAGCVGDADPLQAIADASVLEPPTAIVIAGTPAARAGRADRDLVPKARSRFGCAVVQVAAG